MTRRVVSKYCPLPVEPLERVVSWGVLEYIGFTGENRLLSTISMFDITVFYILKNRGARDNYEAW